MSAALTQWEYLGQVVAGDPQAVYDFCAAAGRQGWELCSTIGVTIGAPTPSPLLPGGGRFKDQRIQQAMAPQPGLYMLFKRPLQTTVTLSNGETAEKEGESCPPQ